MLSYRKELDGLRAVAVIAVIVYHANLELFGIPIFQGGFFGVDVFFVLSGYLITGIIQNSINFGTFSIVDYYWRRIKRIIPALLTVVVVISGIAYYVLSPSDLVKYAESLNSVLYFGSNYHFYNEDSYMAQASMHKPLLHTWSLAVEWQFYFVYPIIVWFVNQYFKKYVFGILLCLALVSLQYSNYIVISQPDAAFYLLPARAWELILGGLVSFYNRDHLVRINIGSLESVFLKILPMLGLFLIFHSLLFIDHSVSHPSFITLIPVMGTVLFIMFAHDNEMGNDLLSIKPLVFIGIISYPLYLWHQPIFVFFRMMKYDQLRPEQLAILSIASSILAFFTYKYIEIPIRKIKSKIILLFLLFLICVALLLFSIVVIKTSGFSGKYDEFKSIFVNLNVLMLNKENGIECQNSKYPNHCEIKIKSNKETVILLGDSNAGVLSLGIKNYAIMNKYNYIQLSSSGCLTLPDMPRNAYEMAIKNGKKPNKSLIEGDEICTANGNSVFELLEKNPNSIVIYHIHKARISKINTKISKSLEYIANNSKYLNLIYPIPTGKDGIQKSLMKIGDDFEISKIMNNEESYSSSYKQSTYGKEGVYKTFDKVSGGNINRFYMEQYFCTKNRCKTHDHNKIFYYDRNHLSQFGTEIALNDILPKINSNNDSCKERSSCR